MESLFL
jgi:hypothetical protein